MSARAELQFSVSRGSKQTRVRFPTTGPPRLRQPKMDNLAKQLAAALASTDGIPRIIQQLGILYLVTPTMEVWRVFDSHDGTPVSRFDATDNPSVKARIFIGSGPYPVVRVYRFAEGEDRSVSAESLLEQLGKSGASI
jgi:hypothetical protein